MTPSDPTKDLDAYESRLQDIPTMVESLVAKAQQLNERRMRQWGHQIQGAPVSMCDRHPGQPLVADVEQSAHASDKHKRCVIVCQPCPLCQADEARRRAEALILARGVPARAVSMTLEGWDPSWEPTAQESRTRAWQAVSDWTQGRPPVPFLIILGAACGTGKTALGVAALRAFGRDIRCVDFRDLIDALLALDPGPRSDRLDAVRKYPALMIDDLGNRQVGARADDGGNNMERDTLATVLNYRFERRLPTIITSNLEPKAFIRRFDPRTVDRIRAGRVVIDASKWPSRRAAEGL